MPVMMCLRSDAMSDLPLNVMGLPLLGRNRGASDSSVDGGCRDVTGAVACGFPPLFAHHRSPKEESMDRRLRVLADELAAHLISRREFLRQAAIITGGTAAGTHVLRSMASAQPRTKLRIWLFK